jgi:hypothetical protein
VATKQAWAEKPVWTDWATLQPSTPQYDKKTGEPVKWKVQINQHGLFRCSCMAFIYSKAPKGCKHTRRCEQERQIENVKAIDKATVADWRTASVPQPVRPVVPPHWDAACTICDAMLDAARQYANDVQKQAMREVLAARLAVFVPVRAQAPPLQKVAAAIRYITFDD